MSPLPCPSHNIPDSRGRRHCEWCHREVNKDNSRHWRYKQEPWSLICDNQACYEAYLLATLVGAV